MVGCWVWHLFTCFLPKLVSECCTGDFGDFWHLLVIQIPWNFTRLMSTACRTWSHVRFAKSPFHLVCRGGDFGGFLLSAGCTFVTHVHYSSPGHVCNHFLVWYLAFLLQSECSCPKSCIYAAHAILVVFVLFYLSNCHESLSASCSCFTWLPCMLSFCSVHLDAPPHQNHDFGGDALNLLKPSLASRPVVSIVFVSPDPMLAAFICPFCARLL